MMILHTHPAIDTLMTSLMQSQVDVCSLAKSLTSTADVAVASPENTTECHKGMEFKEIGQPQVSNMVSAEVSSMWHCDLWKASNNLKLRKQYVIVILQRPPYGILTRRCATLQEGGIKVGGAYVQEWSILTCN